MSDVTELESSEALGFSGSVTFPVDGVKAGAGRSFDFSSTTKSSTSVLLIVFNWERRGLAKRVGDAQLSTAAKAALASNRESFRDKYGDYFVYQLSHMIKFTAVWYEAFQEIRIPSLNSSVTGSAPLRTHPQ